MKRRALSYRHVDVFSSTPLSGNGLTVFVEGDELASTVMQKITQELRQFESIFLFRTEQPHGFRARIFTMEEELDFAGHPILGAACVLHERLAYARERAEWELQLNAKTVPVTTTRKTRSYLATMEQGKPDFGDHLPFKYRHEFPRALNLADDDLHAGLPLQVVSTGLPYLIVPLRSSLEKARICDPQFEQMLAEVGARFVYVLHLPTLEGRTWDNDGRVEDIATGSAAGPVGAYLVRHEVVPPEKQLLINQGRFVGRPSQIVVSIGGRANEITSVEVSGEVCMIARGTFDEGVIAIS